MGKEAILEVPPQATKRLAKAPMEIGLIIFINIFFKNVAKVLFFSEIHANFLIKY